MPEVVLRRLSKQRADRLRTYRVFIDNQKVGKIREGESQSFPVRPGEHELQLKVDWATSEKRQFNIGDNDRASFVCKPRASARSFFKRGIEFIYLGTLGRKRYIELLPGNSE